MLRLRSKVKWKAKESIQLSHQLICDISYRQITTASRRSYTAPVTRMKLACQKERMFGMKSGWGHTRCWRFSSTFWFEDQDHFRSSVVLWARVTRTAKSVLAVSVFLSSSLHGRGLKERKLDVEFPVKGTKRESPNFRRTPEKSSRKVYDSTAVVFWHKFSSRSLSLVSGGATTQLTRTQALCSKFWRFLSCEITKSFYESLVRRLTFSRAKNDLVCCLDLFGLLWSTQLSKTCIWKHKAELFVNRGLGNSAPKMQLDWQLLHVSSCVQNMNWGISAFGFLAWSTSADMERDIHPLVSV